MFKKTILTSAVAFMAMGSVSAMAADVGLITFDGAVTDTTCVITTNNGVDANNVTVTLPVVKKADVEGTTVDTGVGSKEFELHLSKCPDTVKKAAAVFTSQQFAELSNGTLKTDPTVAGHADNVSLALFNNTAALTDRIKVGQPGDATQKVTVTAGEGTLAYRVAYVPSADWTKGTKDVAAGKVSSNVTFTMSYE